MGGASRRFARNHVALLGQPHHPARPARHVQFHLQFGRRAFQEGQVQLRRGLPLRRHQHPHAAPRRILGRRAQVGHPRRGHPPGGGRSRGRHLGLRLRPPRGQNRGQILRHLVQRLSWRPHYRRRLDRRFPDVPPTRKRLSALQPQRRALPPQNRRPLRHAFASERHGSGDATGSS